MPPPGAAVTTVTLAVPASLISVLGTVAVSEVLLMNVVTSFFEFHSILEPGTKFVPVAVSVNDAPPCVAEFGEIEFRVGAGLSTVKFEDAEIPPPGAGLVTVTLNVPVFAMSEALMVAVSLVALTYVVVRGDPAQSTTDVLTKFLPFTVSVKPELPTSMLFGEREVIAGLLFLTVKVSGEDVPPPGLGLVAVTLTVSAVVKSEAGTVADSNMPLL